MESSLGRRGGVGMKAGGGGRQAECSRSFVCWCSERGGVGVREPREQRPASPGHWFPNGAVCAKAGP